MAAAAAVAWAARLVREAATARIHSIAELPSHHRAAMVMSLTVSQFGWWTAAVVGYLETLGRR